MAKKLYRFIEINDDIPIHKLKIIDQIRVLWHHISHDDATELANDDYATAQRLTLKADLLDFIWKSTALIRSGKHKNVVMNIDSKFKPVLNEVLKSKDIMDYYEVKIAEPKIEYDVPYNIVVSLTVKES